MSDPQRLYRYEVPQDGRWHPVQGCDTPLFVGARRSDPVEFWARPNGGTGIRWFRVYDTGRDVPGDAVYRGSVITNGGLYVWHLFEHRDPPKDQRAAA